MLAVKLLNWVWFPVIVRYSGTVPEAESDQGLNSLCICCIGA